LANDEKANSVARWDFILCRPAVIAHFNPDYAVPADAMSEEQTWSSEGTQL
jgi:hypothetical protein